MKAHALTCKLTTPELQERKRTIIAELKNLVLETVETPNGIRFKFNGSDSTIDLLTTFIKTERLCCDFFTFTLTVGDEESDVWLELSGPKGVKEFIENEMGFSLHNDCAPIRAERMRVCRFNFDRIPTQMDYNLFHLFISLISSASFMNKSKV